MPTRKEMLRYVILAAALFAAYRFYQSRKPVIAITAGKEEMLNLDPSVIKQFSANLKPL